MFLKLRVAAVILIVMPAIAMPVAAAEGVSQVGVLPAGADVAATDEQRVNKPYRIRIEVDAPGVVTYGDPLVVSVWVTQRGKAVTGVYIYPKGDIADIYLDDTVDPLLRAKEIEYARKSNVGGATRCDFDGDHVKANVPYLVRCTLLPRRLSFLSWFGKILFLSPGRQRVEIMVVVPDYPPSRNSADEDGSSVAIDDIGVASREIKYYEKVDVEFSNSKKVVIVGGLAGALLLSILTLLPAERIRNPKIEWDLSWGDLILRVWSAMPGLIRYFSAVIFGAMLQAILGGVCAMVLIAIAQSTDGLSPPISIRIQDFWGGLIVGLLSVPLARWLKSNLRRMLN